jgi:DDE superfamily endonuclease
VGRDKRVRHSATLGMASDSVQRAIARCSIAWRISGRRDRNAVSNEASQAVAAVLHEICSAAAAAAVARVQLRVPLVHRNPFNFTRHAEEVMKHKFKRLYRLGKEDSWAMRSFANSLDSAAIPTTTIKPSVGIDVMLALTLRILAGASYLDLWPYGNADCTVYTVVDERLDALEFVLTNINFLISETECTAEAIKFQNARRSPICGIVAALDGIAVAIQRPSNRDGQHARNCFNRKRFYSICVQAAVGADYCVSYVSFIHAGSTHDSTAFQSTTLHENLGKSERDGGLLNWATVAADDAYGNKGRLFTPYACRPLTSAQDSFKLHLSSCRMFVELVFGIIDNLFGIMWSPMRCSVMKASLIIFVCCMIRDYIVDQRQAQGIQGNELPIPFDNDNPANGDAAISVQDELHLEPGTARHIRHDESGGLSGRISKNLAELGLVRPSSRT